MTDTFDLIDTFSHRPSLSPLALAELRAALEVQYPALTIDPEVAAVTGVSGDSETVFETLIDCLRLDFSTGRTPRWKCGQNTLVGNPAASTPLALPTVDVEQLAVLVDTVSLGLSEKIMQSLVAFWDSPDKDGISPWKKLSEALALHSHAVVRTTRLVSSEAADGGPAVADAERIDFEKKALQVLEAQLAGAQELLDARLGDFDEIERDLARITDIAPLLQVAQPVKLAPRVSRLEQLPGWLSAASSADRLDYSRRVSALAVTVARATGQAWNDDLPPILEYAARTMQDGLRDDHPRATWLTLDDVIVHLAKVVAAPVPSAGQIISMGDVEHIQMSVATFALENLSSLPNGTLTLSMRDGGPVPDWLTADYLKQLVVRVDIGRTYPALVRRYLIDDLPQVAHRQTLFANQLRVQLPLKALEQKIRGQGEMTQAGYRRVCALLDAPGTGAAGDSVLRRLAWVARPGGSVDEVGNMFVIGSADTAVGPFVLYRPFAQVPLREFATWSQLRDAIATADELQDEVLAWMSEQARQRYANGGFDQPHIVRFGLGSDFAPLETPAPAQLASAAVQGDPMSALFTANANALVALADRESVSNAESRWALIQRGGWLALDAVMPFFSGVTGTALWLVQMMAGVDQVLAAERNKTGPEGAQAWNALLVTISMILLHQGGAPRLAGAGRPPSIRASAVEPAAQVNVPVQEPVAEGNDSVPVPRLDFSWASSNHRLTATRMQSLERLKISPEPLLGTPCVVPGREGLYKDGQQWRVRLQSGVYEVDFSDEGVHIVDPHTPLSRGPRLRRVDQGWELDLSLKLRGGGPKRTARQLALENAATLKRVTERQAILEQRKAVIKRRFDDWFQMLHTGPEKKPVDLGQLIEADLNELLAMLEEEKQLQQSLRPVDRASEKYLADNLHALGRRISFYEGVLLVSVARMARTQVIRFKAAATSQLTSRFVGDYLKLFEDLLFEQDKGVHWATTRESLWQRLRDVPKVGEKVWRDEMLDSARYKTCTSLEWRANRLWSLLELSFSEDEVLSGHSVSELKKLRTNENLHAAFSSHVELEKPNDYTLSEQIDVLQSSLREYRRAALVATYAKESAPEVLQLARFDRFLAELTWISDYAEKRLSDAIRESIEPSEQLHEYMPKVRQPRKRIFKNRAQRTLIGRLREGEPDLSGTVIDVTQPMSDTVISTYHLHENGEWVEVETAGPSRPQSAVALGELKRRASAALGQVDRDIGIARSQARRGGEPADMEDILKYKAEQLNTLADKLAVHVAEASQGESAANTLQTKVDTLRSAASRLVQEGRAVRIAMIKAQPPTAGRLRYLVDEREAEITRFGGLKNMSGTRRDDFLQEYVIRDKDQRVLWWAHFHYASESAAPTAFTKAHLKMPEQRFIGYKAQLRAVKDNKEVVSIYRSDIGKELA